MERVLAINGLETLSVDVVEIAREKLSAKGAKAYFGAYRMPARPAQRRYSPARKR